MFKKANPIGYGMVENLGDLVVDESELNQGLLASVLSRFVRIAKQTGHPVFTAGYSPLAEGDKILVYLLARKAAARLGLLGEGEEASPKEISAESGVKYGTVKPTVVELAENGFLASRDGRYWIPDHAVFRVEGRFTPKG